jgi:hypothetical protein
MKQKVNSKEKYIRKRDLCHSHASVTQKATIPVASIYTWYLGSEMGKQFRLLDFLPRHSKSACTV